MRARKTPQRMAALTTRVPCNILRTLGAGKSDHPQAAAARRRQLGRARERDGRRGHRRRHRRERQRPGQVAESCIYSCGSSVRVALTRLLSPTRLLIEPSGLGHVAELSEHLQKSLCQTRWSYARSRASCRATGILYYGPRRPFIEYGPRLGPADLEPAGRRASMAADVDGGPRNVSAKNHTSGRPRRVFTDWVDAPATLLR